MARRQFIVSSQIIDQNGLWDEKISKDLISSIWLQNFWSKHSFRVPFVSGANARVCLVGE